MQFETHNVFRSALLRDAAALNHGTSDLVRNRPAVIADQTKNSFFHGDMAIHQSEYKANRVFYNYITGLCFTAVASGKIQSMQ